jgi:hypothetical protein
LRQRRSPTGLKSAFNTTADEAAKILKGAGFAANEVGNALKSAYGATADQVAKWLKGAGFAAKRGRRRAQIGVQRLGRSGGEAAAAGRIRGQ